MAIKGLKSEQLAVYVLDVFSRSVHSAQVVIAKKQIHLELWSLATVKAYFDVSYNGCGHK